MKTFEFENIKFLLGQNAEENWNILEEAQKINSDYIWFHLNSFSSPYVIMYCTIDELNSTRKNELNDILNFAANLCKQNSKYKYLNQLKIIYTSLKKLSKGSEIGEVIIKGKTNIITL